MSRHLTISNRDMNIEFLSYGGKFDIDIEMTTNCDSCSTTTGQITLTLDDTKKLMWLLRAHIFDVEQRFPELKDVMVYEL